MTPKSIDPRDIAYMEEMDKVVTIWMRAPWYDVEATTKTHVLTKELATKMVDGKRKRCQDCTKGVRRSDEFYCGQCRKWPLCETCMLGVHVQEAHGNRHNVRNQLARRMVAFEKFWKSEGLSNLLHLQNIAKDVMDALQKFDALFKISPCCRQDQRFDNAIMGRRNNLEQQFANYQSAIRLLTHMELVDQFVRGYLLDKIEPSYNAMITILRGNFYLWDTDDMIQYAAQFFSFNELLTNSSVELHKAIASVTMTNSLLDRSLPSKDSSTNGTNGRQRSKSTASVIKKTDGEINGSSDFNGFVGFNGINGINGNRRAFDMDVAKGGQTEIKRKLERSKSIYNLKSTL